MPADGAKRSPENDALSPSQGKGLWEIFCEYQARLAPQLSEEAFDAVPQSHVNPAGHELPHERRVAEAMHWVWCELIPLDEPYIQAYLRGGLTGLKSPFSRGRLLVEVQIHDLLGAIADDSDRGALILSGVDPVHRTRYRFDATPLRTLTGPDRFLQQFPSKDGPITGLRFVEADAPDPRQDDLRLEKKMTRQEFLYDLHDRGIKPGAPGHPPWDQIVREARNRCHPHTAGSKRTLQGEWKRLTEAGWPPRSAKE